MHNRISLRRVEVAAQRVANAFRQWEELAALYGETAPETRRAARDFARASESEHETERAYAMA